MTHPAFVLSVSTLGRAAALRILLESLSDQLESDDSVILVAQGNVDEVKALAAEFDHASLGSIVAVTSARGASLGRNTGVAAASAAPQDALLMFPNDTTWFPPGSLAAIRDAMMDKEAGAVQVTTASGPRFVLPPAGTALDRKTVWAVIEMGLVMRLSTFQRVSGFDETIGTGAASPWQAGEVTDLLLRALSADPSLAQDFVWISTASVGGVEEGAGLTVEERAWKLRSYGRGIGHVYRVHHYPPPVTAAFVVAGLLVGIRRRKEYRLRDGWGAMLGRWEGVAGRVIAGSRQYAVTK